MILPGYLYKATSEASEVHEKHTFEASEVHEIEDNMSITRSIRVAHTDYRVLKANCYVDWGLVF